MSLPVLPDPIVIQSSTQIHCNNMANCRMGRRGSGSSGSNWDERFDNFWRFTLSITVLDGGRDEQVSCFLQGAEGMRSVLSPPMPPVLIVPGIPER